MGSADGLRVSGGVLFCADRQLHQPAHLQIRPDPLLHRHPNALHQASPYLTQWINWGFGNGSISADEHPDDGGHVAPGTSGCPTLGHWRPNRQTLLEVLALPSELLPWVQCAQLTDPGLPDQCVRFLRYVAHRADDRRVLHPHFLPFQIQKSMHQTDSVAQLFRHPFRCVCTSIPFS